MRSRRFAVVLALLVVWSGLTASAAAASTTVARFKTSGYAFAAFGDCPDEAEDPPAGTVCRDAFIQVVREAVAVDGGSVSPAKIPWSVFYHEAILTFGAAGEAPRESYIREGFLPFLDDSLVTYDRQHLGFASIDAIIPLSDGSTVDVDLKWQAISDRFVYGNSGPALSDFGLARHHVDMCSTQVNQGHQKFRLAAMVGTVNDQPVQSYTAFPAGFISFNQFVFINAMHGKECG